MAEEQKSNSKKEPKKETSKKPAQKTSVMLTALGIIIACFVTLITGIIYQRIHTIKQTIDTKNTDSNEIAQEISEEKAEGFVQGESAVKETFVPPYINVPPKVTAKSYGVVNLTDEKVMSTLNADTPLQPASITKIMTAIVALEQYEPDRPVVVPLECTQVVGSKAGLKAYDVLSLQDILYALLVSSGADAACAISSISGNPNEFVLKMNEKAKEIGMEDTEFQNEIGLDSAQSQYSTVNDLMKLSRYALKYDTFQKIVGTKEITLRSLNAGNSYKLANTNDLLLSIPGTVGIKTGSTPEAGECLSYMYENPSKNEKILIIILGSQNRFGDTQKLLFWAKDEILNVREKYPTTN